MVEDGVKGAKLVEKLTEDPNKLLGAILIGNNIVNILASSLATTLFVSLVGPSGVGIATAVMTVLVLIFGEITPKSIAKQKSEEVSLKVSKPINIIVKVLKPFVGIFTFISGAFIRMLGGDPKATEPFITEEELKTMVGVSEEEGVLEGVEKEMIFNVFDFADSQAKDVMVQRVDIVAVDSEATYEEVLEVIKKEQFSRIPVYNQTIDDIVGVLYVKDLIIAGQNKEGFKVSDYMREPYYTFEFKKIKELFNEMKKTRNHLSVVLDEYGGTVGIVTIEDLIEEAGRIYGYDKIPTTLPSTDIKGGYSPIQLVRNRAHETLKACGLTQVITYSLTSEEKATQFLSLPADVKETVKLSMPMSEERAYLRQSTIPGLLEVVRYNNARTMANVAIYEIGKVYGQTEGDYVEETKISGAVTGQLIQNKWQGKVENVDFFVAKGYVETLLTEMGHLNVTYRPVDATEYKDFHPGRSAVVLVNDVTVGVVGQVHPALQQELDLNETYVFELSLDALYGLETSKPGYEIIAKHPGMTRDIALVVNREVLADDLVQTIKKAANKLLQTVEVFDIYEGKGVEEGKKSVAISLYYLDREKTLTDEDLQPTHQKVLDALTAEHDAVLRG